MRLLWLNSLCTNVESELVHDTIPSAEPMPPVRPRHPCVPADSRIVPPAKAAGIQRITNVAAMIDTFIFYYSKV